jgi:hypothetical protein
MCLRGCAVLDTLHPAPYTPLRAWEPPTRPARHWAIAWARNSGGLAERLKAAVLKTAVGQPTEGSNPSPSAKLD